MNLRALSRQYPIDKPKLPIQLILLALITVSGLIALFFAAFASFQVATGNQAQAFFAALVIEVGLAVEALALINRPKTITPWIGLIVAYVVSASYNWFQASNHAALISKADNSFAISTFTIGALAFGPLSALAFLSLTLGNELRIYQQRVTKWETDRMEWATQEGKRLEDKAEEERKRLEAKEERAKRRAEKLDEQRNQPETTPESTAQLPEWLPTLPENFRQFKEMVEQGTIILPSGLTGEKLQKSIPVIGTDKTGRNWLRAVGYKNGH